MIPVGKSNMLEYLKKELPYLPIEDFERVKFDARLPSFALMDRIRSVEPIAQNMEFPAIIRSDGPEDEVGKSFAGIFDSYVARDKDSLNRVISLVRKSGKRDLLQNYCENRGIEIPDKEIDVFVQKYVKSEMRAIITRHPNQKREFYIDLEWYLNSSFPDKAGAQISSKDLSNLRSAYRNSETFPSDEEAILSNLEMAINHFEEMENVMSKVGGDKYAFQAEVSILPYSIFQLRPFRIKEYANFSIDNLIDLDDENQFIMKNVLGITPPEGLDLIHLPCNGPYSGRSFLEEIKWAVQSLSENIDLYQFHKDTLVTSFDLANQYADVIDRKFKELPKLIVFNSSIVDNPWQAHESFRLMERADLVGFCINNYSLFKDRDITPCKYYSDGNRGLLQFREL